jgi:SAM-dependent methyltransferase
MADGTRTGIVGAVAPTPTAGWQDEEQVGWYLDRIDRLPPRLAGEAVLAELLPPEPARVLDLGCGDGRLAQLVLDARPSVTSVVGVDLSPPMLEAARERFAGDDRVSLGTHDLNDPIDALAVDGGFDVVVTGFAVHHVDDDRKRALYAEVASLLAPGGLFANIEVVQSATPALHAAFLTAIGRDADDPEDRLAPVEPQLGWLRDAGLVDVDCLWRWRGMALLAGWAPGA